MKILACIDTSRHAEDILRHAAWASRQLGLPVEVLHALEKPSSVTSSDHSGLLAPDSSDALLEDLASIDERRNRVAREQGRTVLESARSFLREQDAGEITLRLVHGSLTDHMREYEGSAGLIIVGKQGESVDRGPGHLGTNLERIIRASTQPVLVVTGAWRPVEHIVIAFDGSPATEKAIDMLVAQRLLNQATAHLLMVGENSPAKHSRLAGPLDRLRKGGYRVNGEILLGNPEDVIPREVERIGADLLVMGAFGHNRIREWIVGSTTSALLRKTTVPLLILR